MKKSSVTLSGKVSCCDYCSCYFFNLVCLYHSPSSVVASRWFIFWEKCIYIQLSAQDHSKCHLFAFMSLVLMDVFELFWRHAISSFSHFVVALSSLGASQLVCLGAKGREPGCEEDRMRKEGLIYLVEDWGCVLYSMDTLEPLQSVTETSITTAPAAGFCSVVLFSSNYRHRTEPWYWTCKTFVKFNHS